jgi:hypothetical protein
MRRRTRNCGSKAFGFFNHGLHRFDLDKPRPRIAGGGSNFPSSFDPCNPGVKFRGREFDGFEVLVPGHCRIQRLGPGIDAAGDVGDGGKTLRTEKLGDAQAAGSVMTDNQEVPVARERCDVLGDLAHGNGLGPGDVADFEFVRLAHINDPHLVRLGVHPLAGFGDGDLERKFGLAHRKTGGCKGTAVGRKRVF